MSIDKYIRKATQTAKLLAPHIEELEEDDTGGHEALLAAVTESWRVLELVASYLEGLKWAHEHHGWVGVLDTVPGGDSTKS